MIKARYPLRIIEDQIDLQKAEMFSRINLKNGFLHVSVAEMIENIRHL